ncbi:uncharacterized protein [Apostichopus japonicus]|uniref:uncharacterized protein isoform X1 n=1 Tax=Stichopus japonicus TaxID=307972 RepID=UPI003AB8F6D4
METHFFQTAENDKRHRVLIFNVVVLYVSLYSSKINGQPCESLRYLEIGKEGVVHCSVDENNFGVYWYNSSQTKFSRPFLSYREGKKADSGYQAGEFDIYPNGSLVINNVTLQHDQSFRVFWKESEEADMQGPYTVRVIVIVTPSQKYPFIKGCDPDESFCFLSENEPFDLQCYVQDARPAVDLIWFRKTVHGDTVIPSNFSVSSKTALITTYANTTFAAFNSSSLSLLKCQAVEPPKVVLHNEVTALVEVVNRDPPRSLKVKYFQLNSRVVLHCAKKRNVFLVWKKWNAHEEVIGYANYLQSNNKKVTSSDFDISMIGSLTLLQAQVKHEGIYVCNYGNGVLSGSQAYNVFMYVLPSHFVVEDCSSTCCCQSEGDRDGTLKCSVRNVRPSVSLEWKTAAEDMNPYITFSDQWTTVDCHGDTYTVTLLSRYHVNHPSLDSIDLECRIRCQHENMFKLSSRLTLFFPVDNTTSDTTSPANVREGCKSDGRAMLMIFSVTSLIVLIIISAINVGLMVNLKRQRRCPRQPPQRPPQASESEMESLAETGRVMQD